MASDNNLDCISFCGRPDVPVKDIEEIVNSDFQAKKSRDLFRAFLGDNGDEKSLIALDVYDLCDEVKNSGELNDNRKIEEIRLLCDKIFSKKRMKEIFEDRDSIIVPDVEKIMKHCKDYYLMETGDYKQFIEQLKEKMKKWKKLKPAKKVCMIL